MCKQNNMAMEFLSSISVSSVISGTTVYATTCFCSVAGCGNALDWIATSDCRVKTNVKPISDALSIVTQLHGVNYQLCGDEKQENQLGLIAQDVMKILPEVVSHSIPSEDDFKYGICDDKLGISYGRIAVILIEAIKEQQIQIKEQEKQLHCLCLELNYMRNSNT